MEKNDDYTWKIILWLILFLCFGIIIIACKRGSSDYIMTVNGLADPSEMAVSLTHEHVLVDFSGADSIIFSHWDRDSVISAILPYLLKVSEYGVNTFIECTPRYLGRDPVLLSELSKRTGMIFLTNTGYYGAHKRYLPASIKDRDASSLSQDWTNEFLNGIEFTGIKPGFIKISVNPDDSLSTEDTKLISAAAITHLSTGLTIVSHTGPGKPAFAQLEILGNYGVDPSAFIWVHAQGGTLEENIEAAERGAWISLDNVRYRPDAEPGSQNSIEWYVERIVALKNKGYLHKILISHDSGWYDPSKPGGGEINGYTDIFEYLVPLLRSKGFKQDDIDQILVRNPAEAFTIKIRKITSNF